MPLVEAGGFLRKALEGKYAIPQFNINNLEWTKSILEVCEEVQSPVILGVSEGAAKYMGGFKTVAGMVKGMMEDLGITIPVALHLDHGTFEGAQKAIEAGFTSVMFDGSHYELDENLDKTKKIVELAHSKGISVEAEVGSIGGEEDGVIGTGELADPAECLQLVNCGIDFLAAGIGNIHGAYPENWAGLNFDRLSEIQKTIGELPMVLHGGTGIPEDMIKRAIELGVSKINVNTELQWAFRDALRKYFEAGKDQEGKGFDPRKILAPGSAAIKEMCKEKIRIFGSANRA